MTEENEEEKQREHPEGCCRTGNITTPNSKSKKTGFCCGGGFRI